MNDLKHLFTDTDTFLSLEELSELQEIDETGVECFIRKGGRDNHFCFDITPQRKIILSLVQKGYVDIFSYYNKFYILSKTHSKCRPVTFLFNIYFPKVIKKDGDEVHILNNEEKDKMAYCRSFISKWIFKKKKIKDNEYLRFVRLYTSRISYIMSIPRFMLEKFYADIEKTGMKFKILTPSYETTICPFCKKEFDSKQQGNMVSCPKCGNEILIR